MMKIGFEQYQEQHRATGSASKSKFSAKESTSELDGVQVDFVGYDPQSLSIDAKIVAIAESSSSNATTVCIHPCPFYGLGGGQVADHGRLIRTNGQVWHVIDVIKSDQGTLALKVRPDQPHNEPLQVSRRI
jgi:alanyl-tRNA synthetase